MRALGLAVAVGDAVLEVNCGALRYQRRCGRGAARELVELILKSKGTWKK